MAVMNMEKKTTRKMRMETILMIAAVDLQVSL